MVSTVLHAECWCVLLDISIAAVDLLQEMTDVEADEDNEDAINAFFDALVCIKTFSWKLMLKNVFVPYLCLITERSNWQQKQSALLFHVP